MKLAPDFDFPSRTDRSALTRPAFQLARERVRACTLVWIVAWSALPAIAWSQAPRSVPDATRSRPTEVTRPYLIQFRGEINQRSAMYFHRRMDQAQEAGADLLLVAVDSPGGLKDVSLQLARRLRDCDWAYTVVAIGNEAISGGALISLGADEIQIDPNAKFGDVGEIAFDFQQQAWRLIEPKVESYLSRDARDLAESKGRPPALAEAMVDKEVLVYRLPGVDGQPAQYEAVRVGAGLRPEPPWELIPETGPERFLTLSGQRTIELGLANGSATSVESLAEEYGFDSNRLVVLRPTATDAAVYYLNTWWATFLLVLIGMTALYLELSAPGISAGGLIAALCAALFFWSHFLGGTAGLLELLLFLAGVGFVMTELFVIPGTGVSAILGALLLFSSFILAGQDFVVPRTNAQWSQTIETMGVAAAAGLVFLGVVAWAAYRLGRVPLLNRAILQSSGPATVAKSEKADKLSPAEPPIVAVGDGGVTTSVLRPAGRVRFGNRSVDVVSDGTYLDVGVPVRVIECTGNLIRVTEIEEPGDDDAKAENRSFPNK